MKKVLLFAASAVLMISSCTKNEVFINPENQKAIEFGTYVGTAPLTKTEMTKVSFKDFYVTAFEVENDGSLATEEYFEDIKVTKTQDGSAWETSSPVYWPLSNQALQFYAYGPATDDIKTYGNGIATLNFNDLRTDYVFAEKKQSQTDGTSVELKFNHILSRIQISAKVAEAISAYNAVVSSLKFTSVSFASTATMDLTSGTVTPGASAFSGTAVEFSPLSNTTVNTTALELTNEGTTIFVAPTSAQQVTTATATVEIKYTLYRTDLKDDVSTTITKTADITFTTLEAGHSYNLILTIPANDLTPITFTVDDHGFGWNSGDGISGDLK